MKKLYGSHSGSQGDLPNCTGTERLLQGQKGKGRHPLVGDVNLLRSLFARIHLDLLAVQGTHKNLLQYHSSKASVLWCSAFLIVQLSHPYMTGKAIALTRRMHLNVLYLSQWLLTAPPTQSSSLEKSQVEPIISQALLRIRTQWVPCHQRSPSDSTQSSLTRLDLRGQWVSPYSLPKTPARAQRPQACPGYQAPC